MAGWYKAGTIEVTNGSTVVIGSQTQFITHVRNGYFLAGPDERVYEIERIKSDDQIILASPYKGVTAASQAYAIAPTQSVIADLAAGVAELVGTFGPLRTALPDVISSAAAAQAAQVAASLSAASANSAATTSAENASSASTSRTAAFASASNAAAAASSADASKNAATASAANAAASAVAAANAATAIISGLRRKTINGNFSINQHGVTGTVVLAAGAYGHDGWKAGTAGCTYTFSTTGVDTLLTITAGSLVQIHDGANIEQAQYVMTWSGSAKGKVSGGTYATSPVLLSATPGSHLIVEFGVGTLGLVQVESGTVPTVFERRPALELQLCRWYYLEIPNFYLFRTTATGNFGGGMATVSFAPMRTPPTLSYTFVSGNYNAPIFGVGRDYVFAYFASGSNVGEYGNYLLKLSAEL